MRLDMEKRKVWRDPYEEAKKLGRPISPKSTMSSKQHKYSIIHRSIGVILCTGNIYMYLKIKIKKLYFFFFFFFFFLFFDIFNNTNTTTALPLLLN